MEELVLLRCTVDARRGVPFSLVVTDRTIQYVRLVSFRRHATESASSELRRVERVTLRRRSPWPLWIAGALLALVPLSVLASFALGMAAGISTLDGS